MTTKSTIVRVIKAIAQTSNALAPTVGAVLLERAFLTPQPRRVSATEAEVMERASIWWLPFDAARPMPVYRWGGPGPTVLLVHGWSGRASQLTPFVDPLLDAGFSVVAFDAPAHGRAAGHVSALPEFIEAIGRVAAHAGDLHGIVAHSLGAAATTFALADGLVAARTVVYVAPPCEPARYLGIAGRRLGFDDNVVGRAQARIEARFGIPFESVSGKGLASRIDAPLTVFHDRHDREVAFSEGVDLVAAWPTAQLVPTEGRGHARILRHGPVLQGTVDEMQRRLPQGETPRKQVFRQAG